MATCFLCGCAIPRGQGNRRRVNTGHSIGGFNLASNPVLGWLLNSALSKRLAPIRSFYSLQTLCAVCTIKHAAAEKRTVLILASGLLLAAILFLFLLLRSH
jgi:hypothetical protein